MTAAENPLDVLRRGCYLGGDVAGVEAALSAVEQLVNAARGVMTQMDYGTPHHTRLHAALARFPVPAQDTGGET